MMSRIFIIAFFLGFSGAQAAQIETPSVCSTYCCYKCGCESLTGCTSPDRPKEPPVAGNTSISPAVPAAEAVKAE